MNKILTVGRELIRGNFGSAVKSMTIDPRNYRGDFFIGADGTEYLFRWRDNKSSLKAYTECPPVAAIINRKAQAYINGKTWVMDSKGKESRSHDAKKIRALMARPNPLQSWKQFEAQKKVYVEVFGWSAMLPIIPKGFERYGAIEASSMWNIPPSMLNIEESTKLFAQKDLRGMIKSMKLVYKEVEVEIDPNQIHIFRDITPSFDTMIFPESRTRALEMPINNIIGAFESRNFLINNRGPLGILTRDNTGNNEYTPSIPMTDSEKVSLQNEFKRYGLRRKQWHYIITTAALKWQSMGVATKDLLLMEEVQESAKSICDAYGYPPHLLGLLDPTFDNQNTAEKGLYQNTIIPEAESIYEEWNNVFGTAERGLDIQKDYSHLPILQEDATAKATARRVLDEALEKEFKNNLITLNRWLELIGEDTRGPEGDKYYSDLNNNTDEQETEQEGDQDSEGDQG